MGRGENGGGEGEGRGREEVISSSKRGTKHTLVCHRVLSTQMENDNNSIVRVESFITCVCGGGENQEEKQNAAFTPRFTFLKTLPYTPSAQYRGDRWAGIVLPAGGETVATSAAGLGVLLACSLGLSCY